MSVVAYVGLPGQGKTLSMINDLEVLLKQGYKIMTNVPFFFPADKYDGKSLNNPNYNYWPDLDQYGFRPIFLDMNYFGKALRTERNVVFAIDEASVVLSNHFWQSMDFGIIHRLAQQRKQGVHIYYTSQRLKHTLSRLREFTTVVVEVEKHSIFGLNYFFNIQYDPEFYNHTISKGTDKERSYVMGRKIITPQRAKALYKAYNTNFEVDGTIINIDETRRSTDVEP